MKVKCYQTNDLCSVVIDDGTPESDGVGPEALVHISRAAFDSQRHTRALMRICRDVMTGDYDSAVDEIRQLEHEAPITKEAS